MARRRQRTFSDQLRQAIDDSGLTRYRIAKEAGIHHAVLNQFYNGERRLSMETIEKLWAFLGLQITTEEKSE